MEEDDKVMVLLNVVLMSEWFKVCLWLNDDSDRLVILMLLMVLCKDGYIGTL